MAPLFVIVVERQAKRSKRWVRRIYPAKLNARGRAVPVKTFEPRWSVVLDKIVTAWVAERGTWAVGRINSETAEIRNFKTPTRKRA